MPALAPTTARYDFASQRKASDGLSRDLLGRILVELLGRIGSYQVWRVNGPLIRDEVDTDFTEGGNSARYGYVPEGHIWVEGAAAEIGATALHEYNEAILMGSGMSYDEAHDKATEGEREFRRSYEGRETLANAAIWQRKRKGIPARGYAPAVVEAARLLQQNPKVVSSAGREWMTSVAPGYEMAAGRNESAEKGWATLLLEAGIPLNVAARLTKIRESTTDDGKSQITRASPFEVANKPPKETDRLNALAVMATIQLSNPRLKDIDGELQEHVLTYINSDMVHSVPVKDERRPLVYEKHDGDQFIMEGAHQLAVALLRGERTARVRLVRMPAPPPPGSKRANLRRISTGYVDPKETWVRKVLKALGHVAEQAGYPPTEGMTSSRVETVNPETGVELPNRGGMLKSGKAVKALSVGLTVAARRADMEAQSRLTTAFAFLHPWVYTQTNYNVSPPSETTFERRAMGDGETFLGFMVREDTLQEFFEWVLLECLKADSGNASEVDWRPTETISEDFYAL